MNSPAYRRSFLSWFVPFLVLLLLAVVMTLDLGSVTTDLQHVQRDAYAAWSHVTDAAMPATPTPQAFGDIRPDVWGSNAAALWPQLWLLFAAGLILLVLLGRRRTIAAFIVTLLIMAGAGGISWLLFAKAKLFFDTINPSVALAFVWFTGAIINSTLGTRPRSRVVAVPVAEEEPVAEVARPEATGAKRNIVYLRCAVREFPALLDSFADVPQAAPFIARALDEFREVVNETGGTIVSAAGDRFAAVWNAPGDDAEAAANACEAATRIMAAAAQIKMTGSNDPENTVAISGGIAGGSALAGTFANGAYAVAGECVDRAEMLRALSAKYGPAVLVGEEIRSAAEKGFAFVEIDCIAGDGRKPEHIYALLGNPLVRASPKFRALSTFHEHLFQAILEKRWVDARQLIAQCRNLSGAIPSLYDLHLARIEWYESHPPPDDWDGAFRPPIA